MEYSSLYDYAGNPINNSSSFAETMPTQNYFNAVAQDFDFGSMLNLTPNGDLGPTMMDNIPAGIAPTIPSYMRGHLIPNRASMPVHFVPGTEYPFPEHPSIAPAPANAMVSAAQSASHVQAEPQLVSLQTEPKTGKRNGRSAGQKKATTTIPQPTPKRTRGRRKKEKTEEEKAMKRQDVLQRNRVAAQKCRQKKKLTEEENRLLLIKLKQDNDFYWDEAAALQNALSPFQFIVRDIENTSVSEDLKALARTGIAAVMEKAASLQNAINKCNATRSEISPDMIMEKRFGGYVQQDTILDGLESYQGGQTPTMSAPSPANSRREGSNGYLPSTAQDAAGQTMSVNSSPNGSGEEMFRKGSGNSDDSGFVHNTPRGPQRASPPDDEAIDDPPYSEEAALDMLSSLEIALRSEIGNGVEIGHDVEVEDDFGMEYIVDSMFVDQLLPSMA